MIHFEITEGPDLNARSSYRYEKNEVYLGSDSFDLCINDPSLKHSHLLLEIPQNDLLAHPQKDVEFYLINGKRATSIRKIKSGDNLTIGSTTIKILEYGLTLHVSKKDLLNAKLDNLIEQGSSRFPLIKHLGKLAK